MSGRAVGPGVDTHTSCAPPATSLATLPGIEPPQPDGRPGRVLTTNRRCRPPHCQGNPSVHGLHVGQAFKLTIHPADGRSREAGRMSVIALRPVEDADLDALFDQMRDPEAVWMAAFTAENPD